MTDSRNFNYISFYDKEYISRNKKRFSLTRDRVFEFTSPVMEQILRPLNKGALRYLESLPTFLCSEIEDGGIYVSGGYIKNVEFSNGTISFEFDFNFEIDATKAEVSNAGGLKSLVEIFGINRMQFYRTHWSVSRGNYSEILEELKKAFGVKIAVNKFESKEVAALPGEVKPDATIQSVAAFLTKVMGFTADDETEYFFRGHHKQSFRIEPSIFRVDEEGNPKFSDKEDMLCKDLIMEHSEEFRSDQTCFDRLVRMQHYGLPTRLLDLTRNPLIALYFACESAPTEDGRVLVFGVKKKKIKYFDSDTVRCIANLSQLTADERNDIRSGLDEVDFNKTPPVARLIDYIKCEKSHFESRITYKDLVNFVCVKAKMTNERIRSQQGAFLLFGLAKILVDEGDLPPVRPSIITRVPGFDTGRFRVGQARRARSPQIAQALGARLPGFGCPARNAA